MNLCVSSLRCTTTRVLIIYNMIISTRDKNDTNKYLIKKLIPTTYMGLFKLKMNGK